MRLTLIALASLLACGSARTPAIGPDPVVARPAPPPPKVLPVRSIACVIGQFTCAEREGSTLAHVEIAKRCVIDAADADAIGEIISAYIEELYVARCVLGALNSCSY